MQVEFFISSDLRSSTFSNFSFTDFKKVAYISGWAFFYSKPERVYEAYFLQVFPYPKTLKTKYPN